jgi:hypothetical protein
VAEDVRRVRELFVEEIKHWAAAAWEVMQDLSFEQWSILASLIVSAGALYYAWKASRSSEAELELARQEALRHPKLELSDATLIDAQEVDDVIRTREAKEKWREPLKRAMAEDMESPDTRGGFRVFGEAAEKIEKAAKSLGGYTVEQILYDGPYPDLVLTFELRNMGRRVAKDVWGEVAVEGSFLEPIEIPLLDGVVFEGQESAPPLTKAVMLEVGEVPPFPTEDNFMFRIALLKKISVESPRVKTPIVVTFSTPEGDYLKKRLEFAL